MSALALAEAALEEAALQGRSGARLADLWATLHIPATLQPAGAAPQGSKAARGLREAVWACLCRRTDVTFVAPSLAELSLVAGGPAAQRAASLDGLRVVASRDRRLRALGLADPTRAAPFLEVTPACITSFFSL